jgi:transcription elongation factor Elf1
MPEPLTHFSCPICGHKLSSSTTGGKVRYCPDCGEPVRVAIEEESISNDPNPFQHAGLIRVRTPFIEQSAPWPTEPKIEAPIDGRPIVSCPHCRSRLRVPATAVGKTLRCPHCIQPFAAMLDDAIEIVETGLSPATAQGLNWDNLPFAVIWAFVGLLFIFYGMFLAPSFWSGLIWCFAGGVWIVWGCRMVRPKPKPKMKSIKSKEFAELPVSLKLLAIIGIGIGLALGIGAVVHFVAQQNQPAR